MRTKKGEKVLAMWSYSATNGYDGFDWVEVDCIAALCEDCHRNYHLYLDCSYANDNDESDERILITSFNIGFNPLFIMIGLDECVEDLLNEYCMMLELELYDRHHYADELEELEFWEVKSNVLRHMLNVVSLEYDYLIHEFPPNEGVPFRVWINRIL